MGCDIHMHIEVKVAGEWQHLSNPSVMRNYACFTKLAGVRDYGDGGVTPISKPRGLPDDATVMTKVMSDYEGDDGHSHSWINHDEIAEFCKWYDKSQAVVREFSAELWLNTYPGGHGLDVITDDPDAKPDWLEDIRLVFWFDN